MTFIDHLEALRGHLFRSVVAIVVGAGVVAYFNDFFVKKVLNWPLTEVLCIFTPISFMHRASPKPKRRPALQRME